MKISQPRRKRRPPQAPATVPDPPATTVTSVEETPVEMDPLPDGWENLNKEGLQDQCKERNLSQEGYKSALQARLQAWQDEHFPEG